MTKKNAFTLAEVLITLTILGVIAALTIPPLMFTTDEKQSIVGLKKAMTTLDQAVDLARTEPKFQPNPKCYINHEGGSDATADCQELFKYMKNVIQVQKYCDGNPVDGGCMAEYAKVNSCEGWADVEKKKAFITTGGMSFFEYSTEQGAAIVGVDTNGPMGPNKWGFDVFSLELTGTHDSMQTYQPGGCEYAEEGGKTGSELLQESDE